MTASPLLARYNLACLCVAHPACFCRADDDIPPEDCTWISDVVKIFDKWATF